MNRPDNVLIKVSSWKRLRNEVAARRDKLNNIIETIEATIGETRDGVELSLDPGVETCGLLASICFDLRLNNEGEKFSRRAAELQYGKRKAKPVDLEALRDTRRRLEEQESVRN